MFAREHHHNTLSGILFVSLFAMCALYLSEFFVFKKYGISPLIIGIVLGMFYANTLRHKMPHEWTAGVVFSTKTLLRLGIILYGFRLTLHNLQEVGLAGMMTCIAVVTSTFFIGYIVGTRFLKLDKETVILTSVGSSICGAAAILATEPIIHAEAHKSAIAVSTVVIFGSLAMFLYPFLYQLGFIPLLPETMGIYIGGTIHEVAHVVAAGNEISPEASKVAVIVKMIRVMLLAPFLLILGFWLAKTTPAITAHKKTNITIPWFAVFFIVVAGFNSFHFLPQTVVAYINAIDTFLLTMAMSALGMETSIDKFKNVGLKPLYLAGILFLWLIFGGFYIVKLTMI